MAVDKRSLVTGGCGFVGRHLVNALADRGDKVTVLDVRGRAWRDDIEVVHVDLRDAEATVRALTEQDTVFHNASQIHTRHTHVQQVWDVNLGGTQNILAGCQAHGISKLIYVSSASVVYEGKDIHNGDETLPYTAKSQAPYADSKVAAERKVLAANGPALSTCAIRPHLIFGPGDVRLLPAILGRARAGRLKYGVGSGEHLSDFTYVGNLVDALLSAGDRLAPDSPIAGQAYFVTNGEPMEFFDFVGRVLKAMDLPPVRGRVPYAVAYSVATVSETWDTLRGIPIGAEDGMSRFAIRYLCTHHYFNINRARTDLDYEPRVSIDKGISNTAETVRASETQAN